MTRTDDRQVRVLLGEAAEDELRVHRERVAGDQAYRVGFNRLAGLRGQLAALPTPEVAHGLDVRVLATLRARARPDAMAAAMSHQFWRLALPALATGIILWGLAVGAGTDPTATEPATLAAWYPISADPTANR